MLGHVVTSSYTIQQFWPSIMFPSCQLYNHIVHGKMYSFCLCISLRSIGRGSQSVYIQTATKMPDDVTLELPALVGQDGRRGGHFRDDFIEESISDAFSSLIPQCNQPQISRTPVDDRECI